MSHETILFASVSLTAAQIATLKSSPVQVIPAAPPGKIITIIAAQFQYLAGTIPFTNQATPALSNHDEIPNPLWLMPSATTFEYNSVGELQYGPMFGAGNFVLGAAQGPIFLFTDVDPAGAGNGTGKIDIVYMINDTP